MRIEPATATLSESAPAAMGIEMARARRMRCAGSPPVSLPSASTQSRGISRPLPPTPSPAASAHSRLTPSSMPSEPPISRT